MSKGARRRSEIDPAYLEAMNRGEQPSRSLPECLAVDFARLVRHAAPEVEAIELAGLNPTDGITVRMATVGRALAARFGVEGVGRFATHPSDTVRGWAAYLVGAIPEIPLSRRLELVRPLADDPHFGVREWAWIAVRPHVARELDEAIRILTAWTAADSINVRRFAAEVTRPRGVWCAHIAALKAEPHRGLPILVPLNADPAKYVQDSVANWLNDASKTRPEWVREVCGSWSQGDPSPHTRRICKRAMRSLVD